MKKKKKIKKGRFVITAILLSLLFIALFSRLFYLMAMMGPKYQKLAEEQQTTKIQINAKRGQILDRYSNELSMDQDVYRIDLDLKTLRQDLSNGKLSFNELADKLSKIINMKSEDILNILNTKLPDGLPANSALLKRQIEPSAADQVKALNLRGIILSPDIKRYYINGNFMTSILGRINSEGNGISGVEFTYNKELSGTSGSMSYIKDAKNNELPYESEKYVQPINGNNVILTIDSTIQLFAEQAAEKALKDNSAKAVNIIVMNPQNGEILAMANKTILQNSNTSNITNNSKDFNLLLKNSSVQDNFEPGSIFKVITAACALENNIGLNDRYTDNGTIKVDGVDIHCWDLNGHGTESFVDIIKNSCNVGFVQLGQKLGKDKLIATAKKLGFGEKTGIDLPGESSGLLRNPAKTNNVDLATLAFGQGIGVNQVQYMAAFNAIANGGTWVRPHIMKAIAHVDKAENKIIDKTYDNYGKKTVYDSNLASQLRQYLTKVVTEGVGQNAFVQDLNIAGKTGTAQVIDPATGKYAPGKYMSSFAGMAPADNPKISLLISIDEPNGSEYYAGEISAPVAKVMFQQIFNYISAKGENEVLN